MKVAVVFVLLFATVLCRPARKVSSSSSESSEEVARPAAAMKKQAQIQEGAVQNVMAAATNSEESAENSDEGQAAAADTTSENSDSTASTSDTASVNSQDSEDDDDETQEEDTDEDESSDSSESGESSTPSPGTLAPVVVTDEPVAETTAEPIQPTVVTDQGRGDSMGSYPGEYKTIIYVEDKSYQKIPMPYKSYEVMGKKAVAYDYSYGNEVEKGPQVYKALQVHNDLLEEDTSTPEVETQGLDTSGTEEPSPRQAELPEEEQDASSSTSDATSESSSAPEEEQDGESASASQESEDEESQSSEEATATPNAADSESDESQEGDSSESEEGAGPDTTTDQPAVITAK